MKHTSLNQKKVSLRRVLAQESKRADSAVALLGAMVRRHGTQIISNKELAGILMANQEFIIEDVGLDSIRLRFADQETHHIAKAGMSGTAAILAKKMLAEAPNEQ